MYGKKNGAAGENVSKRGWIFDVFEYLIYGVQLFDPPYLEPPSPKANPPYEGTSFRTPRPPRGHFWKVSVAYKKACTTGTLFSSLCLYWWISTRYFSLRKLSEIDRTLSQFFKIFWRNSNFQNSVRYFFRFLCKCLRNILYCLDLKFSIFL